MSLYNNSPAASSTRFPVHDVAAEGLFQRMTALEFLDIEGVMMAKCVEVSENTSVEDALKLMSVHRITVIPVTHEEIVSWDGWQDYSVPPQTQKVRKSTNFHAYVYVRTPHKQMHHTNIAVNAQCTGI
jgi:CBS domain-containing protein